jgi:LmbE family N-acetylglucosaminyl deacetylase
MKFRNHEKELSMNVLAIGAHYDDVELGCGGSLAKHVKRGDRVCVYVPTVSGYVNPQNELVRSNAAALTEAQHAMRILGVHEFISGGFETLRIEFGEDLNREIVRIVEDQKIDRVYTHWTGDSHHDHRAVALASLHSCRHVRQVLMYRSNWYPSEGVFAGNFSIDISSEWEMKEQAIRAHASEIERTGGRWLTYFQNEAENAGIRSGVRYAEVFQIVTWLEA